MNRRWGAQEAMPNACMRSDGRGGNTFSHPPPRWCTFPPPSLRRLQLLVMCILSSTPATEFSNGGQLQLSEFNLGALRLQGNLALVRGTVKAVIDKITVNPNLHGVAEAFDNHRIPLARGLFGSISQIQNSTCLSFCHPPFLLGSAPAFHVGYADIFNDTPEVAGILVEHLPQIMQ